MASTDFLRPGQTNEAERTLLQAGLHFRAVMLNLEMFRWERLAGGYLLEAFE